MLAFSGPVSDEVRLSRQEPIMLPALTQPLVIDNVTATRETTQELHCTTHLKGFFWGGGGGGGEDVGREGGGGGGGGGGRGCTNLVSDEVSAVVD